MSVPPVAATISPVSWIRSDGTPARGPVAITGTEANSSEPAYLAGDASSPWGGSPGVVIASLEYNPSGNQEYTTTSTSLVAIDSSNLALTFTAPPSGRVWIEWMGLLQSSSAGVTITGGVLIGGSQAGSMGSVTGSATGLRLAFKTLVTGLTPDQSYTAEAAWKINGSATAELYYGSGSNGSGPVSMEVRGA